MSGEISYRNQDDSLNTSFTHQDTSLNTSVKSAYIQLKDALHDSFIGIDINRLKRLTFDPIETRVVKNNDLNSIKLDINDDLQREELPEAPSFARQTLQPGDVIISLRFTGAFWAAKVPDDLQETTIAAQNTMVLRPNKDIILPAYLTAWLRSESGVSAVMEHAESAAKHAATEHSKFKSFYALKVGNVRDTLLPVPSLEEQESIASIYAEYAEFQIRYPEELKRKEQAFNQAVNVLTNEVLP